MTEKFHSHKCIVNGEQFDSRREARRYGELLLMQHSGCIKGLQRQVRYTLIPNQYTERDGKKSLSERSVTYIADFVYTDCNTLQKVVEDVKGVRTPEYIIKRKLMLYIHGIKILET